MVAMCKVAKILKFLKDSVWICQKRQDRELNKIEMKFKPLSLASRKCKFLDLVASDCQEAWSGQRISKVCKIALLVGNRPQERA